MRLGLRCSLRTLAVVGAWLFVLALLWRSGDTETAAITLPANEGLVPVLVICGPGEGHERQFARPLGAAFGPDRRIYVADTGNDRVCVFSPEGRFLFEFGGRGVLKPGPGSPVTWRPGRFNFPAGIAVDEHGSVFVADTQNNQIQAFAPDGTFLRAFPPADARVGRGSSGVGGGIAVTSIAVRNGIVVATDTYQVFTFDTNGRLLSQFGKPGREKGDLDHPNGVAIGNDSTIYVSDSNHARLTAFTPNGRVLWNAGVIPADLTDARPRAFDHPRGLAVLGSNLVVADTFGFRLVRVSKEGKVLQRVGSRGSLPGQLDFPSDVDASGESILVCDRGNNRVQVVRIESGK